MNKLSLRQYLLIIAVTLTMNGLVWGLKEMLEPKVPPPTPMVVVKPQAYEDKSPRIYDTFSVRDIGLEQKLVHPGKQPNPGEKFWFVYDTLLVINHWPR